MQISESYVPRNPEPALSVFPQSPPKHKAIRTPGDSVERVVTTYFQWSGHNQVKSPFQERAQMSCAAPHEEITNERQHLGTETW